MSALVTTERYLYEFDEFRVDPVRRRLTRHGEMVPLTPKAFAILLVLIEKRGEVVEKESLIQRVWPDTFVTEANLTQNVSALRKALGERAGDSRFVVTVPGRGYSFVADILEIPRDATGEFPLAGLGMTPLPGSFPAVELPTASPPSPAAAPVEEAPRTQSRAVEEGIVPLPVPVRRRSRLVGAGLLLLAVVLAASSFLYFFRDRLAPQAAGAGAEEAGAAPAGGVRSSVAVLGFRNLSGRPEEAWLSTAFAEMLITELAVGGKVRLISGETVARAQQSLSLPHADSLGGADLEKLRTLLGADLIVVGSYLSLGADAGGKIRLDLRVLKLPDGDTVASLAEVGTEGELFELVSSTGMRLRRALGWSDLSPEQARAMAALRPANQEAAKLYSEGLERMRAFDFRGALDLLEEAAAADPGSAVIRALLSRAWTELGYDARAAAEAENAVKLAASLPKDQRLAIEARAFETTKQWGKASEIYRSLWTFFPDDLESGLRLAHTLSAGGRGAEAKAVLLALRKLPAPDGEDPRIDLAEAQIARRLSDPATQKRAGEAAEAKGRKMGESQVTAEGLMQQGSAGLLMGRPGDAVRYFEEAKDLFAEAGNQTAVARAFTHIGVAYHEQGELETAEKMYQESLSTMRRIGSASGTALQLANLGMLAQDRGNLPQSQELLEQGAAAFGELGDRVFEARAINALGTVLWSRGDTDGARQRFETTLTLARETSDRTDEARALDNLGMVQAARGELAEARRLHEQGYEMSRALGDPSRAAGMMAGSATVVARQGDLALAQKRYEEALAAKRQARDKMMIGQIQGSLASLALRRGNLTLSRKLTLEQLQTGQRMNARLLSAAALQNLGRLDHAAGDLESARRRFEEALRTNTTSGAELEATMVRLDIARLALAQDRPADAARLAREVAQWYGRREMPDAEGEALALLAEALLRQGRLAEARDVAGRAHARAERSEDRELQIAVATAVAQVEAASGEPETALGRLAAAVEQARQAGFVAGGLEARLIHGIVALGTMNRSAGRDTLLAVQKEAEARGFKQMARRAAAALSVNPLQPLG